MINILGKRAGWYGKLLLWAVIGAALALTINHLAGGHYHPHHHRHHRGALREGWVGAPLAYKMQKGVPSAGPAMVGPPGDYSTWYTPLDANSQGLKVPLQAGELDIFAKNPSKPGCCSASTYSTSTGCVCVTPEQMKYLNERGGNRTLTTEY
jgi:hypothetical protein